MGASVIEIQRDSEAHCLCMPLSLVDQVLIRFTQSYSVPYAGRPEEKYEKTTCPAVFRPAKARSYM